MVENNCSSLEAVNRIYDIKGRKHTSPLAICVGDVPDLKRFAATEHLPHGLLENLLPGPVTLVLNRGIKKERKLLYSSIIYLFDMHYHLTDAANPWDWFGFQLDIFHIQF